MIRPQFVRSAITAEQIGLLTAILGLSAPMRDAVNRVLLSGMRQVDAAEECGVAQPHVSRALASVRRLDAAIRTAYPARQRVREAADSPT